MLREPQQPVELRPELDFALASSGATADFALDFKTVAPAVAIGVGAVPLGIESVDSGPRAIRQMAPVYPAGARLRRIEGSAEVEYTVLKDGRTADIAVVGSEPPGVFARTVRLAVKRWRFKPALLDGKPVAVRVHQKIRFKLQQ